MLIGREKETQELLKALQSDKSEFVAVYGRRRVGKTYLLYETYEKDIAFFHTGLQPSKEKESKEEKLKRQLEKFQINLIRYGLTEDLAAPSSWLRAFDALGRGLTKKWKGKRAVVFLDELPWMDTEGSFFLEAFADFWNNYCVPAKTIVLAVTGSASSWMLDHVIHATGGLSDRVTCPIRLLPFTLREAELFLNEKGIHYSRYEIAEAHMMVGGIPYYLDLFKAELSLYQNIDELFFNPGARLHGEYNDLFTSQFEKHDLSKRIVEMLASKSLGFTSKEIADSLGMKSRNKGLYDVLDALETGGFIGQYVPYTGSMRLPRYKLLDPFCLFYLKHIAQNKGKRSYWQSFGSSPKASAWRGYAFENLCFCHEAEIVKAMGIGGMSTSASLWYRKGSEQEKGSQIDLIIERADNIVNLCEMKFYSGEVRCDKESHLNLMGKMESLQSCIARKYSILNVLVTTFGLYKGAYSSDYPIVIVLDDLFQ